MHEDAEFRRQYVLPNGFRTLFAASSALSSGVCLILLNQIQNSSLQEIYTDHFFKF